MIACTKHNDSLLGVFYSFFHNIEGPKLAAKYPPEHGCFFPVMRSCISLDTFNSISDFVITKDQLCGSLISIAMKDVEVVGYPIQISSHHYTRNAFNFNVCFIVKRGFSAEYELMVKKIALKLECMEREKDFLQRVDVIVAMERANHA